jgi:ABC-type phosphate transport system substrate-binding protein
MPMLRIILITALLFLTLDAREFVVIANKANAFDTLLSKQEIRRIYLKKRRYSGPFKLVPINLSPSDPLRKEFETALMGMSGRQLAAYWAKQHYQGHRPPLTMISVESVVAFVREVEGAIGYVPKEAVDGSVRVIYEQERDR